MKETIELFGETLRYDAESSDWSFLLWKGPTIKLSIYRYFDDEAARWSLSADGRDAVYETYSHETVAEAAHHLATILMAEVEERAQFVRRLLAELSPEMQGGER